MKKYMIINIMSTILFTIVLKISGACIASHYDDNFGWPKIYGIEIGNIEISWQVILTIMIVLIIIHFISLFKTLFTIVKLKKLSLKVSKNQLVLTFLSLVIVIASVTLTVFEREEYAATVKVDPKVFMKSYDYDSITVDENNKGYVVLKRDDKETRIKASSKAIDAVKKVYDDKNGAMYISYRRNILLQTEYKISTISATRSPQIHQVYYISYFRRRKDISSFNPSHYNIYNKYLVKYLKSIRWGE